MEQKSILVVEDEESLRNLFTYLLEKEGYKVSSAADGEEGYNKMLQGGFDLVLLDIILPKLDGIEILQKLSTTPPINKNKAVVMLTNLSGDDKVQKALSYGAVGYIIKSNFTPDELLIKINEFIKLTL